MTASECSAKIDLLSLSLVKKHSKLKWLKVLKTLSRTSLYLKFKRRGVPVKRDKNLYSSSKGNYRQTLSYLTGLRLRKMHLPVVSLYK